MEDRIKAALMLFNQTNRTEPLILPVEYYRQKLVEYLTELYINGNQIKKQSQEAYETSIVLAHYLTPSDTVLKKEAKQIIASDNYRYRTHYVVQAHLQKVMQILGNICELMIVDHCIFDKLLNQKCLNVAAFKNDISKQYPDIDYDSYIPFLPAKKFIRNPAGLLIPNTFNYTGNHPSQDILWYNKDDKSDILQIVVPNSKYTQYACLQIKTTSEIKYAINSDQYILSPIILISINSENKFKFVDNSEALAQVAILMNNLDRKLTDEALMYFKLMIAHIAGFWNVEIPIQERDYLERGALRYLLSTSLEDLFSDTILKERKEKVERVAEYIRINSSTNDMIGAFLKI